MPVGQCWQGHGWQIGWFRFRRQRQNLVSSCRRRCGLSRSGAVVCVVPPSTWCFRHPELLNPVDSSSRPAAGTPSCSGCRVPGVPEVQPVAHGIGPRSSVLTCRGSCSSARSSTLPAAGRPLRRFSVLSARCGAGRGPRCALTMAFSVRADLAGRPRGDAVRAATWTLLHRRARAAAAARTSSSAEPSVSRTSLAVSALICLLSATSGVCMAIALGKWQVGNLPMRRAANSSFRLPLSTPPPVRLYSRCSRWACLTPYRASPGRALRLNSTAPPSSTMNAAIALTSAKSGFLRWIRCRSGEAACFG